MGATCSRFMRNITRIKSEDNEEVIDNDLLKKPGNFSLLLSVQKLLAVCFNCAVFVVVGMAVKDIAGPAMVLSVILGGVIALLNSLCVSELCITSPRSTSYYSIIYCNVGELCAFMLGWFQVLQNVLMIAIVSYTAGEYIKYLAEPALSYVWSPDIAAWTNVRLDALVFMLAFLLILSIVVAAGLPEHSVYLLALCWTSIAVFAFMFLVILNNANSINWLLIRKFQPFDFAGTIEGVAISSFFFTNLDKVVEQTKLMTNPTTTMPVTLSITLLTVLAYYLCSTIFVAVLVPIEYMNKTATIPKLFAMTTFHSSKYILSSVALLIFCLMIFESYFRAQKLLDNLVQDSLFAIKSVCSKNPKKVPVASVLMLSVLSVPVFIWLPVEYAIQGYCVVALLLSIVINCSTIVVQYKSDQDSDHHSGVLPSWECTKACIKRFLLCFGYITHNRVLTKCGLTKQERPTQESSKIVNWSVLSYAISCICLSLLMFHGLPVIGRKPWMMLTAVILLLGSLFLTIRIIMIQPRQRPRFFHHGFVAVLTPLVNIALFSILLISLHWMAFCAVGVWLIIGLVIYLFYGISHSQQSFQSAEEPDEANEKIEFNEPPELNTDVKQVQPENLDVYSDESDEGDDSINYSFPQKY